MTLRINNNNNNWIYIAHFPLDQSAVAYIITPSGNRDNHCASPRMNCSRPSARPIHTLIVTFNTTDRSQIRSGQRRKLRLSILPRDTNTLAVAGLELTILMVYSDHESCTFPLDHACSHDLPTFGLATLQTRTCAPNPFAQYLSHNLFFIKKKTTV